MSYRLVYTHKAVRDLDRLDAGVKKRIGTTLLRFKDNPPNTPNRCLILNSADTVIRIGDYRVIFDIEGNDIVVLRVGHRREIYKRK